MSEQSFEGYVSAKKLKFHQSAWCRELILFCFPFFTQTASFLTKNIQKSFLISWILGSLLTLFFWLYGQGMPSFEGKLLLTFMLCNLIAHHIQYVFNAEAQESLKSIEDEKTNDEEKNILHSNVAFILSFISSLAWFFLLTKNFLRPFDSVFADGLMAFLSGYLLAVFYSFILVSFYMNKGLLNRKFMPLFWTIIILASAVNYFGVFDG